MVYIKKKEGETTGSLLYRFSKKIKQSGVLREAKKRRFRARPMSHLKRKLSALHREMKKKEEERKRKFGIREE